MTDLRNLPDVVRNRLAGVIDLSASRHAGFDLDYRGKTLEERRSQRIEVRADKSGAPVITGYATVYEAPYDVAGGPPYGWTETIARGAAARSVDQRDQVYMFFDHDGLPLASTKDGSLTLESDAVGLFNEARIDPSSGWSMEIVGRLRSGLLDSESFAFQALRQEWNEDYTERRILEVKLFDVSVVSSPANPATVAQVRSDTPRLAAAQAILAEMRSRVA